MAVMLHDAFEQYYERLRYILGDRYDDLIRWPDLRVALAGAMAAGADYVIAAREVEDEVDIIDPVALKHEIDLFLGVELRPKTGDSQ